MSRRFVLVKVSVLDGSSVTEAAGIKKLKRGVTLSDFAAEFHGDLKAEENTTSSTVRDSTIMVTHRVAPKKMFTWYFSEYAEEDLLSAVSHLSREELLRDLKELLPLKAGWEAKS